MKPKIQIGNLSTNRNSIFSKKMRLSQKFRACGTLSFIMTIDYTQMEFVEVALITIFHIPEVDALALTLTVHTRGRALAGTYSLEIA